MLQGLDTEEDGEAETDLDSMKEKICVTSYCVEKVEFMTICNHFKSTDSRLFMESKRA